MHVADVCAPPSTTSKPEGAHLAFTVALGELRSFYSVETTRRQKGAPHIKLIGDDGSAYMPLYFPEHGGNDQMNNFCGVLQR